MPHCSNRSLPCADSRGALPPVAQGAPPPGNIYEAEKALNALFTQKGKDGQAVQAGTPMTVSGEAPANRKRLTGVDPAPRFSAS